MAKFSLYQRGQTYWLDCYVNGERVRRSTGCRSEAEAWPVSYTHLTLPTKA